MKHPIISQIPIIQYDPSPMFAGVTRFNCALILWLVILDTKDQIITNEILEHVVFMLLIEFCKVNKKIGVFISIMHSLCFVLQPTT